MSSRLLLFGGGSAATGGSVEALAELRVPEAKFGELGDEEAKEHDDGGEEEEQHSDSEGPAWEVHGVLELSKSNDPPPR